MKRPALNINLRTSVIALGTALQSCVQMARRQRPTVRVPVKLGHTFYKADTPSIDWAVDRINLNTDPAHVELMKLDDPRTRITVSIDALSDPHFFRRSVAEPN